ncbi:MAG: hypothetical protein ACOZHQ_08870 [Thermodesulfobacteriota bacterium]
MQQRIHPRKRHPGHHASPRPRPRWLPQWRRPGDTPAGRSLGRLLWLIGLAGLALGLLAGLYCGQRANLAESAYRAIWQDALDTEQRGATYHRLRLPEGAWPHYRWIERFEGGLDWPDGPLPGQNNYKIKALAGLELETTQKLHFRVEANDGVSMFLNGDLIFDQWRPWPGKIDARFTTEAVSGRLLLEIDYVRVKDHGGLRVEVRDEAGRQLEVFPLKPEVDAEAWLNLRQRRDSWRKRQCVSLVLALLLFLLPVTYQILRHPPDPARLRALAAGVAPGFWLGFWLAMLRQMIAYLASDEGDDLTLMLLVPLAAGLAGALVQAGLAAGLGRRQRARLERLRRWYLAHENWLLPGLAFLGLAGFYAWAVTSLGGVAPHVWLQAPWDARHYQDIAENWYWLRRNELGGVWGNFPWHPFYPLLARGLILLGVDPAWAMLLVAWPLAIIGCYLLFRIARDLWGAAAARWTLLALACHPCAWYLLIGYPYGAALALGAGYFLALRAERWWLVFLLGYLLGMTYPTGIAIGTLPVMLLLPRIGRAPDPWPELARLLVAGAGPALGLITFCLHHWWLFNDFWLPISGHANWGRQAMWPWVSVIEGVLADPPIYNEVIVTLLIVFSLLIFGHRFHPGLWGLLLAVWLIGPSTGPLESTYRQNVITWPLFMLIASSPRSPWLKAAWLWLWLYFALKWYLPLWLAGDLV